ncbi:F-box protein PP2-A12 [Vitis vinifera]|uniref:F-box protein PP2-A12 n=1 Tax=Vitis vinifera TaxID=29760 RepID=A0A438JJB9_VITVI|nr:F-box protein PP2-A12 [Vitis vinifera]
MGTGVSLLACENEGCPSRPRLGDLPEDCVALVLSYLDPPEICKLAKLNRAFRGASRADLVWEPKLPSNYCLVIEKVFKDFPENLCKKEIYARLCQPNPFDGGTKKAWLDKRTGGVCLSISSKGLAITGIDDRRYWTYIPTEESRFNTVAYVQQIWWLEVDGEVDFPFPAGTYSIFFRLQLGRASKRLGHGQHATSQCFLDEPGRWIQYHAADFVVDNSNAPTKIKFSMTQIDCTHTKGGLCVDSVLIYPREFRERLKHF